MGEHQSSWLHYLSIYSIQKVSYCGFLQFLLEEIWLHTNDYVIIEI